MKNLMTAAGLIALAASAAMALVEPIVRGYSTGKECYQGSGCANTATLLDCLACCTANCNYGGLIVGCSDTCTGDTDKSYAAINQAAMVLSLPWSANSPQAVDTLVLCAMSSNGKVALFARRVAAEFPVAKAAIGLADHNEQGGLRNRA